MPARCFDPALAEYPTHLVAIDAIVDPLAVSHAPERIAAYRDAMRAGDQFPPISVLRVGRRYAVVDGHKRFHAYRAFAATDILVEVWTVRRWLRDSGRSYGGRRASKSPSRAAFPIRGRAAKPVRLARDTVGHWRRIVRSLWRLRSTPTSRGQR